MLTVGSKLRLPPSIPGKLSKSRQWQSQLRGFRNHRRRVKGIVQPLHQVPVSEKVQAQHRRQVRKRPASLGEVVQPLDQQQGDQSCPNLDVKGVLVGSDESLDLQVLLDAFEKKFDFPAVLVNGRDGCGAELKVIGQQHDLAFILLVPDADATEKVRTLLGRSHARELNELVGEDVVVRRGFVLLDDLVGSVVLEAGHEEDSIFSPPGEKLVVIVAAVHGHDRARVEAQQACGLDVVALGPGDQDVGRQVIVVVQEDVQLDAALGASELGPWEELQAQGDGAGVEGEELVAEPELGFPGTESTLTAESPQCRPEEFPEQGSRAMFVGVREGGFVGRLLDSEVDQLAEAAGEAVADLSQRVGVCELAEKHGYEMGPGRESLGMPLSSVLSDQRNELCTGEVLKELTEQACNLYHENALLCGLSRSVSRQNRFCQIRGGVSFLSSFRIYFGQE